jgi:tricorn protease
VIAGLLGIALAGGYLQHPTVHGDQLVFAAEGDLWVAPLAGGTAERLTTHVEVESQPSLSSDGRVAFLAHYDGPEAVYVMPVAGGRPKRLTWEDAPLTIEGWTAAGEVLISSADVAGPAGRRVLRALDPADGSTTDWPLLDANQGIETPDGTRVVTRFGIHVKGDHARGYRGGLQGQLWTLAPDDDEATRLLPAHDGALGDPLWVDGRLYVVSDVSGTPNLYSTTLDGSDLRQHTDWTDLGVRRPETDGRTIVYQRGADLYRWQPGDDGSVRIPITLRSDGDDARQRWLADPLDADVAMTLFPGEDRVAATVRGRVVTAGLDDTRRILLADGPRLRGAVVSGDGQWVYAISPIDGQDQIVRVRTDGRPGREVLTTERVGRRWRLALSPDGQRVVHSDGEGTLWSTDTRTRTSERIASEPTGDDGFWGLTFHPDGRLLAYARRSGPQVGVFLHDLEDGRVEAVTRPRFDAYSPAFSPDGHWLYFVSDRHFEATPGGPWGDRNMGPAFLSRGGLYAVSLDGSARFPFLADGLGSPVSEDDEEPEDTSGRKKGKRRKRTERTEPPAVQWDGLQDRVREVPRRPADYAAVLVGRDHLYAVATEPGDDENHLLSITMDADAEVEHIADDIDDVALSADGKRLFWRSGSSAWIVAADGSKPRDRGEHAVDLNGWRLPVDPGAEWVAMFDDAWRMHRDLSFDRAMRGADWDAVYDRYAPLAERVTHRAELDDVLGLMGAELGILHSQVRGAELPDDDEGGRDATLAAVFQPVEGGLRVDTIYADDPDLIDRRSPLVRPEVDVRPGDVLVAVDRQPVASRADLAQVLVDKAGDRVLLEVRRGDGPVREVVVEPLGAWELDWRRYRHWENRTRAHVEDVGAGRIGYVHLSAMTGWDIADFAREYFAVSDRPGLILDVRGNRGGSIDSWILGELSRRTWAFWQAPGEERAHGDANMQRSFRGHLVVLIDENTYSDGETFAAGIRALDLGPLVGTRTAGAGVWLSDRNPLVDGGRVRVAEYAQYALDGRWIIEGRGVAPDLEVVQPPVAAYRGEDAQLDAAIALVLERIAAEPVPELRGKPIAPIGTPADDIAPPRPPR